MDASGERRPRVGLVLGAGGFAGTAFHAGVLTALAEDLGWDAREAEVLVGTSAGSTSAALLRGGFPPADYRARVSGEPMSEEGERLLGGVPQVSSPPRRPRARLRPSSPALLARAVRRPFGVPPGALLAAALPEGQLANEDVTTAIAPLHGERWPDRDLWLCAVRLDTGARVVFGRDADAPAATVAQAVQASCAIPGYYAPVQLDGVRLVDGGVRSLCNLDLVAGVGLDLVLVSAPMSTTSWLEAERDAPARLAVRAQLEQEARAVRRQGTPVVVLQPGAELRSAMRGGAMDARRRPLVAGLARTTVLARLGGDAAAHLELLRGG